MSTTGLIAEVLVIGAQAFLWIAALAQLVVPQQFGQWTDVTGPRINQVAALLALPALAITYTLGWTISFVSQRALEPFVRGKLRDREAAFYFYQHASPSLVEALTLDRHVMRLTRGTAFNAGLLAVSMVPQMTTFPLAPWIAVLAAAMSAIMLWHWRIRSRNYYTQMRDFAVWHSTPPRRTADAVEAMHPSVLPLERSADGAAPHITPQQPTAEKRGGSAASR